MHVNCHTTGANQRQPSSVYGEKETKVKRKKKGNNDNSSEIVPVSRHTHKGLKKNRYISTPLHSDGKFRQPGPEEI